MPGSVSAARMNVSSPIMPNWSVTIPEGMFVTRPVTTAAAGQVRVGQTHKLNDYFLAANGRRQHALCSVRQWSLR